MDTNNFFDSRVFGVEWPAFLSGSDAVAHTLLFQLEHSQWWPAERIVAQQLRQMHHLIKYAAQNIPFHKKRLAEVAACPIEAFTLDKLRSIPLMSPEDTQNFAADKVDANLSKYHGQTFHFHTSGSTGKPRQIYRTALDCLMNTVISLRYHYWHQYQFSAKKLSIKPRAKEQSANVKKSWLSGYKTGPNIIYDVNTSIVALADHLFEHDPDYLEINPSSLKLIIDLSCERQQKPKQLQKITTYGESVTDELRAYCLEAWGVPIIDCYSCEEIGLMALQCPNSTDYHVQSERVFIEILDDDDNPCKPGEIGRIVITQLHNFAMPLIRYDIQDLATLGTSCGCERALPVITKIHGRVRNRMCMPDGTQMVPQFDFSALMDQLSVKQYQVIQSELTTLTLKIVANKALSTGQENILKKHIDKKLGAPFTYQFEYTDTLIRNPNCKLEQFICEIKS